MVEPGVCEICEQYSEETVKFDYKSMRVCSDCGDLKTVNRPDNKRKRSSEDMRRETHRRVNHSAWMGRKSSS